MQRWSLENNAEVAVGETQADGLTHGQTDTWADRLTDRHDWKYYLSSLSIGKNNICL